MFLKVEMYRQAKTSAERKTCYLTTEMFKYKNICTT